MLSNAIVDGKDNAPKQKQDAYARGQFSESDLEASGCKLMFSCYQMRPATPVHQGVDVFRSTSLSTNFLQKPSLFAHEHGHGQVHAHGCKLGSSWDVETEEVFWH